MDPVRSVTRCRACESSSFDSFFDLGNQPASNALLTADELEKPASRYPLATMRCEACQLVQLTHVVDPSVLFRRDYTYFTGVSAGMTVHFARMANDLTMRLVPAGGLVLEIGSNDGVLLESLKGANVRALGVDPSETACAAARGRGVEVVCDYFCERVATTILAQHGTASLVMANNVVAHVDDMTGLFEAVALLLAPSGYFVLEAPWIVDTIEGLAFDTIYHEHLSYLGIQPLMTALEAAGLMLVSVEHQPVHGGSIRVFAMRSSDVIGHPPRGFEHLLARERKVVTPERLARFALDARTAADDLRRSIIQSHLVAKRIVGYTAPAKATVLLNYAGIGPDLLPYLVDATPAKQGKYVPGVAIPIVTPERFHADDPHEAVLFAWNHTDEVLRREAHWRSNGGKFLVPLPSLRWA